MFQVNKAAQLSALLIGVHKGKEQCLFLESTTGTCGLGVAKLNVSFSGLVCSVNCINI